MERKIKFWCAIYPITQLYVKLNCVIFLSFSEHVYRSDDKSLA